MREAIRTVMREFYEDGIPGDIVAREIEYAEKLRAATVVKGMRRTGKTYVTYQRMQSLIASGVTIEHIVHLNFEDDRIRMMKAEDLKSINEVHAELYPEAAGGKCWYFLDELQNVEGWEAYARRLLDSPRITLCLTGSSSKLLSEEIATEMRGRSIPIEVFPLSFSEFLRFNGILERIPAGGYTARESGLLRKAAGVYFERGGFPDVQDVSDRMRAAILQGYVDAVLYRDIIDRHEIPNVQALKYTLEYLFHNFARKVSARAISGVLANLALPANRSSVSEYLGYFKDAYLAYAVPVRSDSLAVKRVNPDKMYLVDTGLIRAMCVKVDEERGWLLENLVFLTLRRGLNRIEYYLTRTGREIDFYVYDRVNCKSRLVQVAWSLEDERTIERELAAMREAREETGIKDCVIVTWDTEKEFEEDGVRAVPFWKWTLEDEHTAYPAALPDRECRRLADSANGGN